MLLLIFLRKYNTLSENRTLNLSLLELSEQLEERIQKRTEQLEWNATHDALTGLANRLLLQKHLEEQLQNDLPLQVIYIDLDGFKRINDTLGHAIGDEILKTVATRLAEIVPSQALVARTGGDEFVIVADKNITGLGQLVLRQLEQPFAILDMVLSISASLGIATSPENAESLQRYADAAMYTAKQRGPGQIEWFNDNIRAQLNRRVKIEQQLHAAIQNLQTSCEFQVVYQAIVCAESGQLESLEALIRWDSPLLGTVSPGEFISIAEETGLIIPITTWVLHCICQQQARWQQDGLTIVPIAINIPMGQIDQPDLYQNIKAALELHQLEAKYLRLELLENAFAQPQVERSLQKFKELGLKIAIDDFGTGYSSLMYLHRLPVSTLKIPHAFTSALEQASIQTLVKSIIGIAKALGLKVVAEGVETTAQLEQLQNWGCDAIQGYLFAQPSNTEIAQQWLSQKILTLKHRINHDL